jgi:hypothetical protein
MRTQYSILIRQKHAKGFLDRDEQRAFADARDAEFIRRYSALYGAGLIERRLNSLRNELWRLFYASSQQLSLFGL